MNNTTDMASYTYDYIEVGDEHSLGCKCCRFGRGDDLPVPKKLSHDEMSKLVKRFSHSVFKDWIKLNAILKRFEGSIQKRWLKKSPSQRREILLKAWPDMARTHRPDFAIGFRNSKKQQPRSRSLISAAYLWPYINLEDLQQRHLLLLYLNSRGRNLPYKFVSADIEAAHLGHGWHGSVEGDYYVMRFLRHDSPSTYGSLIKFNNYTKGGIPYGHSMVSIPVRKSSEMEGTGMAYMPCLGLLGLEIQKGIYSFLVSCAKLILHDVSPTAFFIAPHQPTPAPPHAVATSDWPSFTAHMLEAPYRVPQNMDLERMKTLISARRASAEDHIWMLREDPGYFMDTLREWKEHDRSMLNHPCPHCWAAVAAQMISDAYCYLMFWDQLDVLFKSMPTLDEQLKRANHRTLRLQAKDERRWAQILAVIDDMIEFPISTLSEGIPPAPRLRRCYTWFRGGRPDDPLWSAKYSSMTEAEFRVNILFRSICSHEQRSLHGLNHLVQEVQYMLDKDAEANEVVDSWIIGHYSDLALLSELKLRVEGLMPWCQSWKAKKVHESKEVRKAVCQRSCSY